MSLKEKYVKKALRFLKEKNEYKKEVVTEMFYGIDLDEDLPHMYYIGDTLRKEYINVIKQDFINDILTILDTRLDLVDFNNFRFKQNTFEDKKDYISFLVQNFYIQGGMVKLDLYLASIHNKMEVSSLRLLKNNFC